MSQQRPWARVARHIWTLLRGRPAVAAGWMREELRHTLRGMTTIPTVRLPGGVEAPQLGLGTWALRGAACERAVVEALELGYRHIDTAEGYGNEAEIGSAIRGLPRGELFLTSKVWRDNLRRGDLRAACEGSLRRLGTDYLDLLLIHWPNRAIPLEETIAAFVELREDGLIRGWGVSNFTTTHLRELAGRDDVATHQVELHPYFRQDAVVAACRELGIPITAYTPLAKGRVTRDEVLLRIGRAHGATAAQVALAWTLQRRRLVIPKASGRQHLQDNLGALDLELSEQELREVEARPQSPRIVDGEWSEFDQEERY